jgi:hypothetical protein
VSVRLPLAFVLGVATAVLVACGGGSSDKLIPASSADQIKNDLADLRQAIGEHACDAAQQKLSQVKQEIDNLPASVDARLRRRLRTGVATLSARVPVDCQQPATTETTPTTTETTPTTTETTPTTTETTPTTTETTPTTTTPPDTTTTDGGSGSGGVTAP